MCKSNHIIVRSMVAGGDKQKYAIKILVEIEQNLDETSIWKLQAENNIQLKYTPTEEPSDCNRQEDNNFVFYRGEG